MVQLAACFALLLAQTSAQGLREGISLASGAPLREFPIVRSSDGVLRTSLVLTATLTRGASFDMVSRTYNGSFPGPALALFPGDELEILLVNDLEGPMGLDAMGHAHGDWYKHPNTTNLHTHGLHVAEKQPGDDVVHTMVPPGASFPYRYRLRQDQAPGLAWVHPHAHGAESVQLGGGAFSPLIVLDPPGFLSRQLAEMEEHVLAIHDLKKPKLELAAKEAGDELLRFDRWEAQSSELVLVNGGERPVLTTRPGQWKRLRILCALSGNWIYLDFGSCDVALLAKDGIYISDFPRRVSRIAMVSGGRADVVVRCPAGPDVEVASVATPSNRSSLLFKPTQGVLVAPVFSIRAVGEPVAAEELEPWAPASRPAYLADTLGGEEPSCRCTTDFGNSMSHDIAGAKDLGINQHLYRGAGRYTNRWPEGALVERALLGMHRHSFHQHSYPFQIVEIEETEADPYFKVGDWHDSYQNAMAPNAVVRFRTEDFGGDMMVHCHNLAHVDKGMIALDWVGGSGPDACRCEGDHFPDPAANLLAVPLISSTATWISCVLASIAVLGAAVAGVRRTGRCVARDSEYASFPEDAARA